MARPKRNQKAVSQSHSQSHSKRRGKHGQHAGRKAELSTARDKHKLKGSVAPSVNPNMIPLVEQQQPPSTLHPPPTSTRPRPPFKRNDTILLVGEGDFSFACALVQSHGCRQVLATCLDGEEELYRKYPQARGHVALLKSSGAVVRFGIDAGRLGVALGKGARRGWEALRGESTLEGGPVVEEEEEQEEEEECGGEGEEKDKEKQNRQPGWDKIVFNFPHVGGKSTDVNRQVRYNQELLASFFKAAAPLLRQSSPLPPLTYSHSRGVQRPLHARAPPPAGQILVTLFEGEPYTLWNIRDLARHVNMDLCLQTSFRFRPHLYPAYRHARTLGNIGPQKVSNRGGNRRSPDTNGVEGVDARADADSDGNSDDVGIGDDHDNASVLDGGPIQTKKSAWRGEDRLARTYVFGKSTNGGTFTTGAVGTGDGDRRKHERRSKPKKKRKRGESSSDDDSD